MPQVAREPALRLRKPIDRSIRLGHPWIYRDAVDGSEPAGTIVSVLDPAGGFVARGLADEGPIAARVFTTRDEQLSDGLLLARVERALELRRRMLPGETDAWRLLHGEGDRLPGFVCDVYGAYAVVKTDGAGARVWRDAIVRALEPALTSLGIETVLLRATGRSDAKPEVDAPKVTVLRGPAPPARLAVREHGMTLLVDLMHGQKTGLFLDQRESRARVRALSRGLRVLNLYGYTGGFSIAAGLGGATRVETVDVAPAAVAMADETWRANGLAPEAHVAVAADVPAHLGALTRARARFDLIVADPPSFAPRESSVEAALKSYRALHAACMGLIAPGGYYLAASCSSHVGRVAFEQTVLDAALRAGVVLQRLDAWGAPADHPCLAAFPEGEYLKALLYRVG